MKVILRSQPYRKTYLRIAAVPCVLTLTLLAIITNAVAETILIDDFSDPSLDGWTHVDSTVGKSWGPGVVEVNDGSLFLTTTDKVPWNGNGRGYHFLRWDESTDPKYSEGFLRSKVRVDTLDGVAAMLMRYRGSLASGFDGYAFVALAGYGFGYNRIRDTRLERESFIPGITFDPGEDWWMEAGVNGNRITLKVWQDGDPEPEEPQLSLTDSAYREGWFGLDANMNFGSETEGFPDVTYDDVYFTFPSVLGDFDDDGQLLASDINLLGAALGSTDESDLGRYDLDDSGVIDDEDHRIWVEDLFGTHFGDADLNGEVDFSDFLTLSGRFAQAGQWQDGDFDGTGDVQFADFLLLSSNFGNSASGVATVPEPNTGVLALIAVCVGCVLRSRR